MTRHPLSGYPLEHEHVITFHHVVADLVTVRCSCGVATRGPLLEELAGHTAREHRRVVHPRFRG